MEVLQEVGFQSLVEMSTSSAGTDLQHSHGPAFRRDRAQGPASAETFKLGVSLLKGWWLQKQNGDYEKGFELCFC